MQESSPIKLAVLASVVAILSLSKVANSLQPTHAHKEYPFGQIIIEQGWVTEPPLVGQLNQIEVRVINGEEPVRNAFANLAVTIQKGGGQGKELESGNWSPMLC